MFEPGKTMFPTLNIENPCNRVFRFFPLFLSLISSILSSLLFCGFSKFDLFSVFHFPGRNVSLHLRQGRTEMSLTFKLCTSLEIVICLFFKFKTLQNVSLSSFWSPAHEAFTFSIVYELTFLLPKLFSFSKDGWRIAYASVYTEHNAKKSPNLSHSEQNTIQKPTHFRHTPRTHVIRDFLKARNTTHGSDKQSDQAVF